MLPRHGRGHWFNPKYRPPVQPRLFEYVIVIAGNDPGAIGHLMGRPQGAVAFTGAARRNCSRVSSARVLPPPGAPFANAGD